MYWRRDCIEVCWSYPWMSVGIRLGGRPYNERRKAEGPAEQGSTRSTVRRSKGRPNRARAARGGKGSTAKVVEGNRVVLSIQGRKPCKGVTVDAAGSLLSATGIRDAVGRQNCAVELPQRGTNSLLTKRVWITMSAVSATPTGREPADDGGHNPTFRRAVCEQHLSGSVRGAPG